MSAETSFRSPTVFDRPSACLRNCQIYLSAERVKSKTMNFLKSWSTTEETFLPLLVSIGGLFVELMFDIHFIGFNNNFN